jgi:hypothetical protein
MKPALALLALFATSLAAAQMTVSPRVVAVPPPAGAPARTVLPPRAEVAEALAIDPQIADLRHELSLLRRELRGQQEEIAMLKACAAALAAEARAPGLADRMAVATPGAAAAVADQGSLATIQAVAQPRPKRFADCG